MSAQRLTNRPLRFIFVFSTNTPRLLKKFPPSTKPFIWDLVYQEKNLHKDATTKYLLITACIPGHPHIFDLRCILDVEVSVILTRNFLLNTTLLLATLPYNSAIAATDSLEQQQLSLRMASLDFRTQPPQVYYTTVDCLKFPISS